MFFRDQTPASPASSRELPHPESRTNTDERAYLDVPFAEKNDAKRLGARWDNVKRMWYAPREEPELMDRWGLSARQLTTLEGEDRQFGEDELRIEFAPRSCWCKKIRYALERDEVNRVQDLVFGRVNRTCEVCGVQDLDKPFQMHGRWEYDKQTSTQTLKRIVTMCQECFDVTHFGATSYAGRRDYAMLHWQKVTGRTEMECQAHIDQAYQTARELNERVWTLDLSLLTNNGIKCAPPKPAGGTGGGKLPESSATATTQRAAMPRMMHRSGTTRPVSSTPKPTSDSGTRATPPETGRSMFSFRGS
jgi:hypothetical protein